MPLVVGGNQVDPSLYLHALQMQSQAANRDADIRDQNTRYQLAQRQHDHDQAISLAHYAEQMQKQKQFHNDELAHQQAVLGQNATLRNDVLDQRKVEAENLAKHRGEMEKIGLQHAVAAEKQHMATQRGAQEGALARRRQQNAMALYHTEMQNADLAMKNGMPGSDLVAQHHKELAMAALKGTHPEQVNAPDAEQAPIVQYDENGPIEQIDENPDPVTPTPEEALPADQKPLPTLESIMQKAAQQKQERQAAADALKTKGEDRRQSGQDFNQGMATKKFDRAEQVHNEETQAFIQNNRIDQDLSDEEKGVLRARLAPDTVRTSELKANPTLRGIIEDLTAEEIAHMAPDAFKNLGALTPDDKFNIGVRIWRDKASKDLKALKGVHLGQVQKLLSASSTPASQKPTGTPPAIMPDATASGTQPQATPAAPAPVNSPTIKNPEAYKAAVKAAMDQGITDRAQLRKIGEEAGNK